MAQWMTKRPSNPTKQINFSAASIFQTVLLIVCSLSLIFSTLKMSAYAGDLEEVLKAGKLRHLGIPYANFVSNQREGLDNFMDMSKDEIRTKIAK